MKIICIHQSADLYGSDRSFLQVINYMVESQRFTKITIILPRSGPLADILVAKGIEIIYLDLSLLSKTYLKKLQFGKILFPLLNFNKKLRLINEYDIVYVNTSVILDFYVLAPFLKIKKIIHIREIPSAWLSKILSGLLKLSESNIIFNSNSTLSSFSPLKNSVVVHNSFEGYSYDELERGIESPENPLKILLIGRINSWKGQEFTIKALSILPNRNFHLRIVGSTSAGNEILLDKLKSLVTDLNLESHVDFIEFIPDPSAEYKNADVVIVPSTKPEPFGRIAIEAMSVGKPVIAANHGGLPEIIQHNNNGFLFKPGSPESFNSYISSYQENRNLLKTHGQASRRIFLEHFSVSNMHLRLEPIFFNV